MIGDHIILRVCEGNMSVVTSEEDCDWRVFHSILEAEQWLEKNIQYFRIGDSFWIMQVCSKYELDERVQRTMRRCWIEHEETINGNKSDNRIAEVA